MKTLGHPRIAAPLAFAAAVAANAFPDDYPILSDAQITQVSNTFNNVMAYHQDEGGSQSVFTPDQWDKLGDCTRTNRMNIMNGKTLLVDNTTPAGAARDGFSECFGAGVGGPFLTITKAVALRATRGDALIGKP
jgi:hypothetical protein